MAFTFVGYFSPWPGQPLPADIEDTRAQGTVGPQAFRDKVRSLRSVLPPTCKLIGSWPTGPLRGGVMVIEAESWSDIDAINAHYRGYLAFDWHPTRGPRPD